MTNLIVIDKAGEIVETPPRTALTRIEHVRDEMARVYRNARIGKIETSEATKLTYILMALSKVIESSIIEKGIDALEVELRKENTRGKR